jgi:hypothetical protein
VRAQLVRLASFVSVMVMLSEPYMLATICTMLCVRQHQEGCGDACMEWTTVDGAKPRICAGALAGKPVTFFVSTATQGGGQETTILTALTQSTHHGMIYVPPGYASVEVARTAQTRHVC